VTVAVVTDSTPYLPPHLVERWGVSQVSLYVGWEGDLKPEAGYDDLDAFYARLAESPTLPVTSQPSVGDFLAVFEPIAREGRAIVSVHIAEGLSGTCESAREAGRQVQERFGSRVEVVDGATGAGGLGCLVIAAARAAEDGADVDGVVEAIRSTHERLDIWFCLDTLEYLKRGGRIGAAQALVGSLLSIKPLLDISTGEVAEAGKARTRRKALEWLRDQAFSRPKVEHLVVAHGMAPEVDAMVELLSPRYARDELSIATIGPTIGTHGGPRVMGLTWVDPE
jgi:DegV family protein with EDD domain